MLKELLENTIDAGQLTSFSAEDLQDWNFTRRVITAIRTLRSRGTIPPRQKINISIIVGAGFEVYTAAAHIDVPSEKTKLRKEQARLATLLKKIEGKLNNAAFCSKAPPHILQEQREKQSLLQEQLHSVRLNLQALGD